MSIRGSLLSFGLHYGFNDSADKLIKWAETQFTDHSRGLPAALAKANDRAWEAVGLALAGESLFGWVKDVFRNADMKGVRDQIKQFLDATPTGLEAAHPDARVKAAEEWSRLRKAGRFAVVQMPPAEVARRVGSMARHGDPARLTADAHRAVREEAEALRADAPHLADLLTAAPAGGAPLLASAFAFFFRREVETNPELAAGLTFDYLRQISLKQEHGLELLNLRTEGILDQIDVLFDALEKSFAALGAKVDDIRGKLDQLIDKFDVATRTTDPLKVSVTNERELAQLRQWRDELRKLPPGLLGSADWSKLGDALAAGGLFGDAQAAHKAAARAATDRAAEAEAEFKAYRDACEQEQWADALSALVRAAELDPARFSPFPLNRYEPIAIIGAGGFGTVIRCRQRLAKGREVAVKTFHAADLGRDVNDVFAEAHTLSELAAPGFVKALLWEYADAAESRPYLVMDYFPGVSLAAHVKKHGRLSVTDFVVIARQVAEAMAAAHDSNVLHRDLKPGNILVLPAGGRWDVRVIDFGLAVRFAVAQASITTSLPRRTRRDQSFAGTLEYASPEQKGLVRAEVGPKSDVYSFGKTMLEALLGTTEPVTDDWDEIAVEPREPLKRLLEKCVVRDPARRHAGFAAIAEALVAFDATARTDRERLEHETFEKSRVAAERLAEEERKKREATEAKRTSDPEAGEEREFEIATDVKMKFCWIPAGKATLGSPAGEKDRQDGEKVHEFATKGFWLGEYEVQQSEWEGVMGDNPSMFKGARLPVERVSWEDCQKFIGKCEVTGLKVKLPHEDEWEYACRGGKGNKQVFYWGDVLNGDKANIDGNYPYGTTAKGDYKKKTTEVGSYAKVAPHPWGLCDMSGNVYEWCENLDTTGGSGRVVRGGSWGGSAGVCRSACRFGFDPADSNYSVVGFRLALIP